MKKIVFGLIFLIPALSYGKIPEAVNLSLDDGKIVATAPSCSRLVRFTLVNQPIGQASEYLLIKSVQGWEKSATHCVARLSGDRLKTLIRDGQTFVVWADSKGRRSDSAELRFTCRTENDCSFSPAADVSCSAESACRLENNGTVGETVSR